jgi:Protein of unknown function (DUF1214)
MNTTSRFQSARSWLLSAAAVLAALLGVVEAAAEDQFPRALPTLDMFEQLSLERRALRISASAKMQRQTNLAKDLYRSNRLAKTPDGRASLENAANSFNLFTSQFAAIDDTARPKLIWAEAAPHDWYGVHWPGSKWAIDNPDNFYRYLAVDSSSRYEIRGQRSGAGPEQETFLLYSSLPGTVVQHGEGAPVISSLKDSDINFEPDGSFTITVGPEPAGPEGNHLQTKPGAKVIFIRDTLNDWTTQFPNRLRIQRVAGPSALPARSDAELADEAASLLSLEVPYWIKFFEEFNYKHPANTVPPVYARAGGWGFLTTGWFNLKDDEAWVVTLDPISAHYLAIQVGDVWGVAADYIEHTSGLNGAQSKPNQDGTYTFVVSARDPGVWNWIDTVGMHLGLFTLRWQQLTDVSPATDKAVRMSTVMKIADLKKALPAETVWVNAEQRKMQQKAHAASFALRFAN